MPKATDTWMPLYVADYLADTGRLTCEQHGAYLLLILDYWRNGPLPDDDGILARLVGLDAKAWRKNRPALLDKFKIEDGRWRHKRIDAELINAAANAERRTEKARAAAEARWSDKPSASPKHAQTDAPSNAGSNAPSMPQAMLVECPPPSPKKERKNPTPTQPSEPPRDGFDAACDAAGLRPQRRTAERERAIWLGWVGLGLNEDEIGEAISAFLAKHDGATNTLARFDATMHDRAARSKAKAPKPAAEHPVDGPNEAKVRALVMAGSHDSPQANTLCRVGLRLNGEALHVAARSQFEAGVVSDNFRYQFERAASVVAGRTMRVEFEVAA